MFKGIKSFGQTYKSPELDMRPERVRRLLASRVPQLLNVYSDRPGGLTGTMSRLLLLYSSDNSSTILHPRPPKPLKY
jgi:hypothetical protein